MEAAGPLEASHRQHPRMSLPPHSVVRASQSQSQRRFEDWGRGHCLLVGEVAPDPELEERGLPLRSVLFCAVGFFFYCGKICNIRFIILVIFKYTVLWHQVCSHYYGTITGSFFLVIDQ